MKIPFEHRIKVEPGDIDEMGHVNNVVYLRWVQEVATKHWETIANEELKKNFKWVVLRHEIDYKNPCFLHDQVVGTTWVGEANGARFDRYVRLISGTGKVLAEARTFWCMLDAATGRPTRITQEIIALL